MARTELHTCRTPACLAFAESADASGIVASRKSLERMTDSRNGTSPQAPVESVPRHSHTHYSARRHQIPKPPKRFVSRVPFWARHSLSEQEKIKHQNNEIKKEHHREKDQHVNRPSFRHGSHCSIGPGPELGQVQWRDRRYFHWFNKYHRARRRSRWPDLGDPRPCSRREAGREHPGRRPGPPSGRRRCRWKQRQRESFCDAVLRK